MTINLTDPANHPANGPLTVERIERVIEALESFLQYRNGSTLDHFIADAVKGMRELREVRKANGEPAMYCSAETIAAAKDGEHLLRTLSSPSGECVIPLYTAPPAPVVSGEYGDAYQGAREDLAIWKRRALEAEKEVQRLSDINDYLVKEAQGETRMGEPVIREPAQVVHNADPSLNAMMRALDVFYADDDVPERAMLAAFKILLADVRSQVQTEPATDNTAQQFEALAKGDAQ
ncbi:hypothetical protein [Kluyvera ascorbata]|uniref:hypothetical protein n=1 Tax=Kluyvera ascorbata TaxID=51288 RepID=UPI002806485D|nr:hypothetical protein [Kluyvera ascorbata]MDU3912240.1 hypothetical protein [Kluyvera ascorbata]